MFNSDKFSCQQSTVTEFSWHYYFTAGVASSVRLSKFIAVAAEFLEIVDVAYLITASHNGAIQLGPRNDVGFVFLVVLRVFT